MRLDLVVIVVGLVDCGWIGGVGLALGWWMRRGAKWIAWLVDLVICVG
jgi:hypothetical protein